MGEQVPFIISTGFKWCYDKSDLLSQLINHSIESYGSGNFCQDTKWLRPVPGLEFCFICLQENRQVVKTLYVCEPPIDEPHNNRCARFLSLFVMPSGKFGTNHFTIQQGRQLIIYLRTSIYPLMLKTTPNIIALRHQEELFPHRLFQTK